MANKPRSPWLTRFLSDFTLGFADGLTVPFALSAGLSSLGRTDTVIDAGLAELCAGSISMGIGGYLAAKDELVARDEMQSSSSLDLPGGDGNERGEELKGMLRRGSSDGGSLDEKDGEAQEEFVRQYLEPLSLPLDLTEDIVSHLKGSGKGLDRVTRDIISQRDTSSSSSSSSSSMGQLLPVSPIASGIYISLGYVIGGLIPLLPYIFTSNVGLGLIWSIVVCLVSLFLFGAGKTWLLRGGGFISNMRQCLWEGTQMLVLGSLAAGASALCVMLLGSSEAPAG